MTEQLKTTIQDEVNQVVHNIVEMGLPRLNANLAATNVVRMLTRGVALSNDDRHWIDDTVQRIIWEQFDKVA
jgi:ribosomal protein S3